MTTRDHDGKHSVELHRPQCLGGYCRESTEEMVVDLCSSRVASDVAFKNKDTDWRPHPYKKYQTYYPNWMITPDPTLEASSYWKWFVARHSAEIAEYFHMKEPDEIPATWSFLTWERVKEDLKTTYNT